MLPVFSYRNLMSFMFLALAFIFPLEKADLFCISDCRSSFLWSLFSVWQNIVWEMIKYVGYVLSDWKAKCSGACGAFAVFAVFAVDSLEFPTVVFAMFNACVASGEKPANESQQQPANLLLRSLKMSEHEADLPAEWLIIFCRFNCKWQACGLFFFSFRFDLFSPLSQHLFIPFLTNSIH